jgi:RNA polymerase sigma-70 factor (ECF subfamily)
MKSIVIVNMISACIEEGEVIVTPEKHPQQLLARSLQEEEEAFAEIVQQHNVMMLQTAYQIVKDHDIAQDVVQDALIKAWLHLPELRNSGALRSWLKRIVINHCISVERKEARSPNLISLSRDELATEFVAQLANDFYGDLERDWDLARAIKYLPVKQQVAIMLHYYNDMTLPSMAKALNLSENTLKKRVQAALINLRRTMKAGDSNEVETCSNQ